MTKKAAIGAILLFVFSFSAKAQNVNDGNITFSQPQPFLFTINTLNPSAHGWSLNYAGGYGENTVTPLGYDGVDQDFMIKGYLGAKFTMLANMGIGFGNNGELRSLQQAEILRDLIGGNTDAGFRIGAGLGFRREFNSDKVGLLRLMAAYENTAWKFGGNVRFEKAFAADRDNIDIISSIGIQRQVTGAFFAGFEAIGQDLEGFWEADEAEGGARLLVGPSLNYVPAASRFSFTLCAGPIIYATRSVAVPNDFALRDLPASNGFTMKFNVGFRL